MKLLLDTCIWPEFQSLLEKRQQDVEYLQANSYVWHDVQVIGYGLEQQRIIITLGSHLEQQIRTHKLPHYGILQLNLFSTGLEQARSCLHLLTHCEQDLKAGRIVTSSDQGISIRSPLDN